MFDFSESELIENITGSVEISYKTGKTESTTNLEHSHEKHELYYLVSSNGRNKYFYIRGQRYTMKAGDILYIPPWYSHHSECESIAHFDRVVLLFDQSIINPLAQMINDTFTEKPIFNEEKLISLSTYGRSSIDVLLKMISNEFSSRQYQYLNMIRLSVVQLFITIIRYGTISGTQILQENKTSNSMISDIASYISVNYAEPLSLASLASEFYMNASALSRGFKSTMGVTITEFINQTRVEKAKEIIEREDITIPRIAESVGINTSTYFSRLFRRYTGLSPAEYRKAIR